MERKPDIDRRALEAMLQRVLGPGLTVARTPSGVAAQVYRVQAAGRVVYARVAEDDHEDLSVDAALLERLGAMGLRVPRVARAAGRDLGLLSRVEVRGFGWIRRQPPVWPLRATSPTYAEFVTSYLPDPWPGPLAALFTAAELEHLWALVDRERGRDLEGGTLAHGDFDRTHIFHLGGDYSGLIDFGEIRGAEPLFDLGHFALWEREGGAVPLLDDLLAGYGEVAALPAGHVELIGRSAILLGLRQLARWLGPPRRLDRGHPMVTGRVARLRRLLGSSGTGRIDPARPGSPR